ncbi:phage portal protein [Paenirhodobacter sp. CAU 1674]|uniref:phage portal protein n=1 Tax=Paenirhodobacter sp. CAU 1674 TaxID=3032596 RepID=UPI0023DB3242|nr:phage portal protein [Paenirhodobacter sp. CAU 1674]MDF2140851.1 phage portal protein [Paenirhodobacter sp. CAU 1674]
MFQQLMKAIAPGVAATRAEDMLRLQIAEARSVHVQRLLGDVRRDKFNAAATGGRFAAWSRPQTSANTELQAALPFLRATSRDLSRNNPFASRALRVLSAHVAGTGVRPRADLSRLEERDRKAVSLQTKEQWDQFVENCDPTGRTDFYGLQRLVTKSVVEGGEALVIWTPREIGGRMRWRCTVVEGDYLDHNRNGDVTGGGRIVQGVEFNKWGERVAYWLFNGHPGERFTGMRGLESRRVPAQFVDHIFEMMRPGQARGIPWFAPVATLMHDVEGLAEAELVRKKLEACISMVINNSHDDGEGTGGSLSPMTDDAGAIVKDASGNPIERMQPGMIVEARPGWGVEFNAPPASPGLTEHMRERLHAIAAGIGATYMQITGDVSQANYSSMREGRIEFERLVDVWQDDLMIMQMGRPAWRRVMFAGQQNGTVQDMPMVATEWTRPKRPWVDPQKDVTASIKEIEAGLSSHQEVIARKGRDPMAVLDEQAAWKEARSERRLDSNGENNGKA